MASKAARGTKRTCQNSDCEARFYDLNRSPAVCPVCQSAYVIASAPVQAAAPVVVEPVAAVARKPKKPVPVVPDEVEAAAPEGEEALADVEVAEEAAAGAGDETFLEEEEEDGGDVTNILGGPVAEGEEEP